MNDLIAWLPGTTLSVGIAIFIVAAVESVAILGLILPGTAMMFAVALRAGQIDMNIYLALACAALGATVGDSISYWLGKTQYHRIPRLWPFSRHPSWLIRGQSFFNKHGGRSILIGRFVGPVRPLIPMIAGMMHMPQSRFLVVNIISAIGWAPLYLLPGYCAGQNAHFSGTASIWIGSLIAVFLVGGLLLLWGSKILAPGTRSYYMLERRMRGSTYRRRLWNALSSPVNGFPLGSIVLLAVCLPCLLAWTFIVWKALPQPLSIDVVTRDLFNEFAKLPCMTNAAKFASMIGDGPGLVALSLPWIVWWTLRKHYAIALHWLAAMLAVPVVNWGIKHSFDRPRPSALLHSYSYPSSHTSGATIFCCLMASYLMTHLPARLRGLCFWTALTLATLMGLSRLIYGVHWLSDLIGGALLGLTLHAIINISYHAFSRKDISWKGAWLPLLGMVILVAARMLVMPLH